MNRKKMEHKQSLDCLSHFQTLQVVQPRSTLGSTVSNFIVRLHEQYLASVENAFIPHCLYSPRV